MNAEELKSGIRLKRTSNKTALSDFEKNKESHEL